MEELEFDPKNIVKIDKSPLMRESDRGCVLICASDIENGLADILINLFKETSELSNTDRKNLFDFTGPLGTFSSKILISKSIGLLNSELFSDINKIRTLRNRAAHSNDSFSLSSDENKSLLESMWISPEKVDT